MDHLIFNEGCTASSGERLVREDLCAEAIRLGRVLVELLPNEPEAMGLLAFMLLVESRRAVRVTPEGDLVLLAHQDRSRWDRTLIAEGQDLVRRAAIPGPRRPAHARCSESSRRAARPRHPRRPGAAAAPPVAGQPDARTARRRRTRAFNEVRVRPRAGRTLENTTPTRFEAFVDELAGACRAA